MNNKPPELDDLASISYGLAYVTFGKESIELVLRNKKWLEKYPDVIRDANSDSEIVKYRTILPPEIVYEIASREECTYDFFTDRDRTRLYSRDRHKKSTELRAIDIEIDTKGYIKVPNHLALSEYGAFCLFKAVDSTYGYKGETGREKSFSDYKG